MEYYIDVTHEDKNSARHDYRTANIAAIKKIYKTFKFSFPKEKAKNRIYAMHYKERPAHGLVTPKKYSNYQVTVLTPPLVLSHALLIKANA